ncbi:MAG: M67 family metallopeptidase [Alphaproteobacteria bacterium]|nr:M67 family metallopeptidase [Alphaproteobacteria bacterium]
MILALGPGLMARIEAHAARARPAEACGLLIGRDGPEGPLVEAIHESANLAPEATRRFEIDPSLQIAVQRELRGGDKRVIGVYHSHPGGTARPSPTDAGEANDPDLAWLILGDDGVRAYRWTGKDFVAIGLSR